MGEVTIDTEGHLCGIFDSKDQLGFMENSPKPTFSPKWELSLNDGLGEG